MKTIAICNQKGGVGKTTTTINLGAALARLGKRVLLIDLDPQRNLSDTLGYAPDNTPSTTNELLYFSAYGMPRDYDAFIRRNDVERVDYIPATPSLCSAPTLLAAVADSNCILSRAVGELDALGRYDFCLIDCKPSLDLLTANALAAATGVLIPVEPEEYAVNGVADLTGTIAQLRRQINPALEIIGVLLTRCDLRRRSVQTVRDDLIAALGDRVFDTMIPFRAEASAAAKERRSCVSTPGGSRIGETYLELAREVLRR